MSLLDLAPYDYDDGPAPDERDLECPYCDGEGEVNSGYWFQCRQTGAWSPINEPCDKCNGRGGFMQPVYPVTADDMDELEAEGINDGW